MNMDEQVSLHPFKCQIAGQLQKSLQSSWKFQPLVSTVLPAAAPQSAVTASTKPAIGVHFVPGLLLLYGIARPPDNY